MITPETAADLAENAQHVLVLDPLTLAAPIIQVEMLDQEQAEFGPNYQHHGLLFCSENGAGPFVSTPVCGRPVVHAMSG